MIENSWGGGGGGGGGHAQDPTSSVPGYVTAHSNSVPTDEIFTEQ